MERFDSPSRPLTHPIEILLVEDQPGDVRLTREALREEKIHNTLRVVPDGAEALALLRREGRYAAAARPDLVLLDLGLPRVSGREVLAAMKRDPALRDIPVVVVTASNALADVHSMLDLGAAGYLTKPLGFRQLAGVVESIAGLWITIVTVDPGARPTLSASPVRRPGG